jgi:hypothetical protein
MDKTEAGLGSNHSRADDRDKMTGHKGDRISAEIMLLYCITRGILRRFWWNIGRRLSNERAREGRKEKDGKWRWLWL